MPGFADTFFGNADQTQALGLLGAGLQAGNAPGGFQAALGLLSPDNQIARKLKEAQLRNYDSEIEARKAAVAKQQQLQDMMASMFGSGGMSAPQISPGAFQPSLGGMGPTLPPDMASQSRPGSRLANLSIDQIAALHAAGGPNLMDAYKWVNDPLKLEQGSTYKDRATGQERFMPKVGEGIAPDRYGFYNDLPGYAQSQGRIEGAKASATEAAKAGQDLVKVVGPDGAERYVTRAEAVRSAQPSQPSQQPSPTPTRPQALVQPGDADRQAIYAQEMRQAQQRLASASTPDDQRRAQSDIDSLGREMQRIGMGPLQASPTSAQAASAAAGKVTAEQRAKDVAEQRKAIMNADMQASGNIAKYQQIGKLLQDVDGGKYTPLGKEFASALNGFGIKIDKNLPNKEAAESMANAAALELRNPSGGAGMPGAMSDQDRKFLAGMTPNMAQSAEGRKQVIDAYVATQRRSQQVATFARNYEKKYGQLDNGFFEQLQAWSNSTPLFGRR